MTGMSRKIGDRIWLVANGGWGGGEAISKAGDANAYLIDGGHELALIDTGIGIDSSDILSNIAASGFDPGKLGKIFLTHAHEDHSRGAQWLKQATGAKLCSGVTTAKALTLNERLLLGGLRPFEDFQFPKTEVDIILGNGDQARIGDVTLTVQDTPGHTWDAVCYWTEIGNRSILFSGDTFIGDQPRHDLGKGVVIRGMLGWLDGHWSTPISQYMSTLENILSRGPDLVLPGHGIPNDAETTIKSMEIAIRKLRTIINDPNLLLMFAMEE